MVNRSKQKGTQAETAVVRKLHELGFRDARRIALSGALDKGDVEVFPGLILEVKGGNAARTASDNQVQAWLAEAERERVNADAHACPLVLVRAGIGVARAEYWWVVMTGKTLSWALNDPYVPNWTMRTTLGDFAKILRENGR